MGNGRIIDAHHHLWRFNERDFGWMDESMGLLRRDFLPGELQQEMAVAQVHGSIVVQARQKLEETEWLLKLAEDHDFIRGVVGWLDLCSGNLDAQLQSMAAHPKLVGVRHVIHDEQDDDFMLRSAFTRGIEKLGAWGLVYDLLLFPGHLTRAIELVSKFPGQNFVLDHISKPLIKSGLMQPWDEDIRRLAEAPNVWCKVSGMVTEADHRGWKYEDFVPYMEVVLEAFGTDRVMLGSDWPVCRLAGEYGEVMNIPLRFIRDLGDEEQMKIKCRNAFDCYNLKA